MYSVYKRLHNVISLAAEKHTFSSKERDVETGLSYFGARYYSSDLSIWLSVDPLADKYPSMSPYTYCANNPVKLVDPNGEDWYYAEDGTFLFRDDKKTNYVFAVSEGAYEKKENGYSINGSKCNKLADGRGCAITHDEFQQMAAFVYNETYQDQDVDKYRVACAIKNRNSNKSESMQKTLNKICYTNDTHEDRMANNRKITGTSTIAYARFYKTSPSDRNKNHAMKTSVAACINALLPNGVDFSLSADGQTKATQWRGSNQKGSNSNRYFSGYPTSTKNQITKFKYN